MDHLRRGSVPIPSVALRAVEDRDQELLLRVFEEAHGQGLRLLPLPACQISALLEMQWRAQAQHYRSHFPGCTRHVILSGEEGSGCVWLHESPNEIRILDLAILVSYRGRGIAAAVLLHLSETAADSRRPLKLSVQKNNLPAIRLYRRLGFVELGCDALQIEMQSESHLQN